MYSMNQFLKRTVLIALVALVSACGGPVVKEEVSAEFSAEGLHQLRASGFEEAYVHPDANLSSYSEFYWHVQP